MPLQNRVTPRGDILALPNRGLFMGNRGILHDAEKTLSRSRWKHHNWIICTLSYKGWHREVMQVGTYTELFFLDEATALAAGHRPCALCRRAAYGAFQEGLRHALRRTQRLTAQALDHMLHAARIERATRQQRQFEARLDDLPDGVMIVQADETLGDNHEDIWLVAGKYLLHWGPKGYDRMLDRPQGITALVLTPRPTVLTLQQGYQPIIHPSANILLGKTPSG